MNTPDLFRTERLAFTLSPPAQAALALAYGKMLQSENDTFRYIIKIGAAALALTHWPSEQNVLQLQGIGKEVLWPRLWQSARHYSGLSTRVYDFSPEYVRLWHDTRSAYNCSCQTDETVTTRIITLGVAILLAARFRSNAKVEISSADTLRSGVIVLTASEA